MRPGIVAVGIVGTVLVSVSGLVGEDVLSAFGEMGTTGAAMVPICADLGYDVSPTGLTTSQATNVPTGGDLPGFGPGQDEQIATARTIVAVGQAAGVPDQGLVVAVSTALQESGLRNLPDGDRDSRGVFQQRPSQGWGTADQVRDVEHAARAFFGGPGSPHHDPASGRTEPPGLLDITGWEQMSVTAAAQAVQRSGFPDAYAKHEERARTVVAAILGTTDRPSGSTLADYRVEGIDAATLETEGVDVEGFCSSAFDRPTTIAVSTVTSLGSPGAWGGHQNGRIPLDQLQALSWAPNHRLRPDAAAALERLAAEYQATFGRPLQITGSYRTYAQQVTLKASKPRLAATPGTSNHGWGTAVDLADGIQTFGTPRHEWMVTHGPTHGWYLPDWARRGGAKPEPWHFEYRG
ncbi:MAG: M15 family metallopeptidase [Micrococcales bacterium]|nr:M15 family metallopeptidase [Micrococcales bacterium]